MKKLLLLIFFISFGCSKDKKEDVIAKNLISSIDFSNDNLSIYPDLDEKTENYAINFLSNERTFDLKVDAVEKEVEILINNSFIGTGNVEFRVSNIEYNKSIKVELKHKNFYQKLYLHSYDNQFPVIQLEKTDNVAEGNLLLCLNNISFNDDVYGLLLIIDHNGVPIFKRLVDNGVTDFKIHPNGYYSYAQRLGKNNFNQNDHEIVVLDQDLNLFDKVRVKNLSATDNHDFLITDQNSYILMSYHSNYRDFTEFGYSENQLTRDSVIQEIDFDGNILFEWNSFDYLDVNDCLNHRFPDDYAHINSIQLIDDQIIASFRGCSQIVSINRQSGNINWSLGGNNPSIIIKDDPFNEFCGQHTAYLNGDNLSIFDNGGHCNFDREDIHGRFSRGLEYKINLDQGYALFKRQFLLENSKDFYSISGGGLSILENNNWLISWGRGINKYNVTEVDNNNNIVMKLKLLNENDEGITLYRIQKSKINNLPVEILNGQIEKLFPL